MKKKGINSNSKLKTVLWYSLCFFVFMLLNQIILVNRFDIPKPMYLYYLFDYSLGFCTKFLPGTIYHLFFKTVVPGQLMAYLTTIVLIIYLSISFLLAKLITRQENVNIRNKATLISLFFISGPTLFSALSNRIGCFDMYWILFGIVFLVIISKKYFRLLIPLLFALCILVQYASVFSFIILFSIVLFYEAANHHGKEKKIYYFLMITGLILAVSLSIYFVGFERSNMHYTIDEFHRELSKWNSTGYSLEGLNVKYIDAYYYLVSPGESVNGLLEEYRDNMSINPNNTSLPSVIASFLYILGGNLLVLVRNFQLNIPKITMVLLISLMLFAPFISLFYRYWIMRLKEEKEIGKKAVFLFSMMQFPITLVACLISTDTTRWVMHAVFVQFVLFFYIVHKDNDFERALSKGFITARNKYIIIYYLCFASMYMDPFT